MTLILASSSAIRRALLEQAGVSFRVERPDVDEARIEATHAGHDFELALSLAEAKAAEVSTRHSGDWVIGGDSVVSVEGRRFMKPRDRDDAADHLLHFSGKAMRLVSAVALARNGELEWNHISDAVLHFRPLSEEFIQAYLDAEWPDVSYCVGVFRMEGLGVTLFDEVEGDHFTILGLPLLPLLGALRERGLMAS
ncbi:Maf family protein [Sphingomonas alba]|uniref:Nucleoside triphosphate pyrophosphatase n=1 Tax=Sphingomonas alba TaxID=2908208 RepID=A0ABT0RMP6_9SPHN|nr:nucleoside triphosphate pyrophosphatase [Sphingomonas alba]MCL6683833.1 Maf family protein [Sphingomonas alba]